MAGADSDSMEPAADIRNPAALSVAAGTATIYRLYEVGYEIHLTRAAELLPSPGAPRARPRRGEGAALVTPKPPLPGRPGPDAGRCGRDRVRRHAVGGALRFRGRIPAAPARGSTASLLAGICAVRVGHSRRRGAAIAPRREAPRAAVLAGAGGTASGHRRSHRRLHRVSSRGPARRHRTGRHATPAVAATRWRRCCSTRARALSPAAKRELLPHRFAYTTHDYAVLTWESALVVEPDTEDQDVEYVLEFANAQLLELRVFDADARRGAPPDVRPGRGGAPATDRALPPVSVAADRAADAGGRHDGDRRAGGERAQGDRRCLSGPGVLRGPQDLPGQRRGAGASTGSWRSPGTPTPC